MELSDMKRRAKAWLTTLQSLRREDIEIILRHPWRSLKAFFKTIGLGWSFVVVIGGVNLLLFAWVGSFAIVWLFFMSFGGWIIYMNIRQSKAIYEQFHTGQLVEKETGDLLKIPEVIKDVQDTLNHKLTGVWCGQLIGQGLYASIQDRGMVIGPPGTGKTTFLISQLLQWSQSLRSFVCLDIKPEIEAITRPYLEALGYEILVYNPTSINTHPYNPLADLHGAESIGELSAALIPSDVAENAVFNECARDFLEALILSVAAEAEPTLPKIATLVESCQSYRDLLAYLMASKDEEVCKLANALAFMADNERLMSSIFATFRSNLRFLRYPAIRQSLEDGHFSLRVLLDKKPVALFLQFEEKHQLTTGKLLSMMISHILRYLIEETDRTAVLILLDEIGNAPFIEGLPQKLNTLRSRQLPTWLYWQSIEQMQKYGKKTDEGANIMLGACDLHMVFRLNDNASAEYISQKIGTVDRSVKMRSYAFQAQQASENLSNHLVKEPKIFAHELQQLPAHEVVCTYKGLAWKGQATPYYQLFTEGNVNLKQVTSEPVL